MKWVRSLAAELFLSWHQRRLLRQLQSDNEASLNALQNFRRNIAMNDKAKNARVRKPETPGIRSAKADPDRKDTAGGPNEPKTTGAPVRDVREDPAPNPDGPAKGKVPMTPRPTDKPVTGA